MTHDQVEIFATEVHTVGFPLVTRGSRAVEDLRRLISMRRAFLANYISTPVDRVPNIQP